jgi:hypothetical protein
VAAISIFGTFDSAIDTVAVRRRCGLIAASPKTINKALAFNRSKNAFQASLRDVRAWAAAGASHYYASASSNSV